MNEEDYIALTGFRHQGQAVEKGAPLRMFPRAAKYLLLNNQIGKAKAKPKASKTPTKKAGS